MKLRAIAKNTYDFVSKNFLCVKNYSEVIGIFVAYAESLLYSLSKPEQVSSEEGMFGFHSSNIVSDIIDEFDLKILLEIDLEQIKDFVSHFEIDKISISIDAEQHLLKLIQVLTDNVKISRFSRESREQLNKVFYFCGYINCSDVICAALIDFYSFAFSKNYMDYHTDYKNFMIFFSRNKISNEELLIKLLNTFLDKFSTEQKWKNECEKFTEIFTWFGNLNYKVVDKKYENLIKNEYIQYLILIYKILSSELKKAVVKYLNQRIADNSLSMDLYAKAVLNSIIKPSQAYEEKLYQSLLANRDNKLKKERRSPDAYDEYINIATNLSLKSSLIDKEKFIHFLLASPTSDSFIHDMNNFDYEKFNLDWLFQFSPGLLIKARKNKIAKKKIQELYKKALLTNSLNKRHKELFMKYFI